MLCETPEWKESDLWIEATAPILLQETSLVWRKQVSFDVFDPRYDICPTFNQN